MRCERIALPTEPYPHRCFMKAFIRKPNYYIKLFGVSQLFTRGWGNEYADKTARLAAFSCEAAHVVSLLPRHPRTFGVLHVLCRRLPLTPLILRLCFPRRCPRRLQGRRTSASRRFACLLRLSLSRHNGVLYPRTCVYNICKTRGCAP